MRTRYLAAAVALVACGGTPAATTTPANRAEPCASRNEVASDDAQVDADDVAVTTRVGGEIRHLAITDHQRVAAGAAIAEIDDTDYAVQVAAALAELAAAIAQADAADAQVEIVKAGGLSSSKDTSVRSADTQADSAAASVARAKAELAKADLDYARAKKLHDGGAVTRQTLEAAQASRDAAQAAVDAANANLAVARDQRQLSESRIAEPAGGVQQSIPVDRQIAAAPLAHAHVLRAQAALDFAKLQLGYTRITAPIAGVISKLGAREGQLVQPGATLLMIVPETTYVIASFKETDRIAPGDPVEISIGRRVLHGKVDSVSARFAMMPPDNASGNLVKVGRGVPVRIVWNDGQNLAQLRAGLPAAVRVCLQH